MLWLSLLRGTVERGRMDTVWRNIVFVGFLIVWGGGAIILGVRMMKAARDYLRQFPPVDGVPLDWLGPDNLFGARAREIWWVQTHRQTDPELERMRQEGWRRWRHDGLWIFGFPVPCIYLNHRRGAGQTRAT